MFFYGMDVVLRDFFFVTIKAFRWYYFVDHERLDIQQQ